MEKQFTTAELQEVEGEKLFIASTDTEDRQGEIISVDGWELKNFKKNPVMLWGHNHNEPPVATADVGFKTVNGKKCLTCKPKFHEITERAREIKKMVEEGIIKAVSVGFLPSERDGNTFTKQELLEISFVGVPANPEAVMLAYSKGISQKTIDEVFIKGMLSGGMKSKMKQTMSMMNEMSSDMEAMMEEMIGKDASADMKKLMKKSSTQMRGAKESMTMMMDMDGGKSVEIPEEKNELLDKLNELIDISRQKETVERSNDSGTAIKDDKLHEVKRSAQIIQKAVELALKTLKEI